MEREMLPENHNDKLPLICFAPTLPLHFLVCLVLILSIFTYSSVSLSVLNFFPLFQIVFEAVALLSLARNWLYPKPSIEVKRILSRQARAVHKRPFSWSLLRH